MHNNVFTSHSVSPPPLLHLPPMSMFRFVGKFRVVGHLQETVPHDILVAASHTAQRCHAHRACRSWKHVLRNDCSTNQCRISYKVRSQKGQLAIPAQLSHVMHTSGGSAACPRVVGKEPEARHALVHSRCTGYPT